MSFSDSWVNRKAELQDLAKKIDSSIILTTKDSLFWRLISWIVVIVTFGKMSRKSFLENFASTIGPIQAYPKNWPYMFVLPVIYHESRHVYQFRKFGLGISPWVGIVPMAICYLFLPLPIGFSYFRYLLEKDAELSYLREMKRNGNSFVVISNQAIYFASVVASGKYGWCWPYSWILKDLEKEVKNLWEE